MIPNTNESKLTNYSNGTNMLPIPAKRYRKDGMQCCAKKFLPLITIQSMYKSLFECCFRYCIPVWGCCGTTTLDKLQKLQNRAARIATNSRYDTPSQPLIKGLGWFTIKELIEIETARMVLKSLNDSAPKYMAQIPTDFNVPKMKSADGHNCFSCRGALF